MSICSNSCTEPTFLFLFTRDFTPVTFHGKESATLICLTPLKPELQYELQEVHIVQTNLSSSLWYTRKKKYITKSHKVTRIKRRAIKQTTHYIKWNFRFSRRRVSRWLSSGLFRPDDRGCKHLWNVGKLLPDYTAQHNTKQPSSTRYILDSSHH
jgi:hypothetical protein